MKTNHASVAVMQAAVLIALVFHATISWAAAPNGYPPENMTYQGFLADGNGEPLGNTNTGPKNYDVVFRIWTDASVGTKVWAEQQTITVDKGYFSVLLGEGAPFQSEPHPALSTLFTNVANASDRYVEIMVKGIGPGNQDVTILPRLRLLTSPYAFLARNAVAAQSIVSSVNSNVLVVSGTNIGISKANPSSALDVNGTVTAGGVIAGTVNALSAAYVNALTVTNAATVNGALTANTFNGNGLNITNLNANNLLSGTVADARISANVPKLNANQTFTGTNGFSGTINFGTTTRQMLTLFDPQYAMGVQDYTIYNRSGRNFAWFKGGAHTNAELNPGPGGLCMMALNNGLLGIGTGSADRPLVLKAGGVDNQQWVGLRNASDVTKWHINNVSNGINFVETGVADGRLFLGPGGNVGINNMVPTVALDINGTIKVSGLPTMSAIGSYNVYWDSSSHSMGHGGSSRRYKENIQPMETDWSAILDAQPVIFTWIGKPDQWDYGFIAEDLDALGLAPLVIYDQLGRPDAVKYEKVALYLLPIIKAQQQELQEKEARLAALEQSVAELKAMVSSLAEKVNASGK